MVWIQVDDVEIAEFDSPCIWGSQYDRIRDGLEITVPKNKEFGVCPSC